MSQPANAAPERRIDAPSALLSLALAAGFWYVTFATGLLNFWLSMGCAATILTVIALVRGGLPVRREQLTVRALVLGVGSAVVLYGVFWLGNLLSTRLFGFAQPQVQSIYGIRSQGELWAISLVLLFVTSPAEELYWRGYLQRWTMQRFGPVAGWLLGAGFYAAVHIASANFMLVMAALVAGLFWGFIYMRERNLVPVILSHALWTLGIFVLFPIH